MSDTLNLIAKETKGKSFKTFKYCFDGVSVPRLDYDEENYQITWLHYGETEYSRDGDTIDLKPLADKLLESPPLFQYFLDGSRKIYKVDDMAYKNQLYPIIAGQVGVGCCTRENGEMHPLYVKQTPFYERLFVISLPQKAKQSTWDNDELSFGYLRKVINNQTRLQNYNFEITKIKSYSTSVEAGEKMENKGIATIQDYMIEREKNMVSRLVKSNLLNSEQYLLKDGSLEYQIHDLSSKEAKIFCNNYRFVVGASKSFNPANCIDNHKNNNSNLIAKLPLYHRTPVQLYQSDKIGDNMNFAIWFVRIRNQKYTNNAFDGILKLEKILTDEESNKGLETGEVDVITANIINERNPVCYGVDKRWANHLYPIYVTEKFIKSMYLSENMFLSFF
ncbi:hypothetical protein [Megasphaera elsdenii]|uniref:hypothetical protein n=1 Tax=Megasphaera elsdenii TaxID=907 RepID=UPI0014745BA7|nr:hypothetical protein [Megasphaera elsdenii]NME18221.1 hypothetical protein [Megasphaera elsdenii]